MSPEELFWPSRFVAFEDKSKIMSSFKIVLILSDPSVYVNLPFLAATAHTHAHKPFTNIILNIPCRF